MALATAIAKGGCGLSRLHLSANLIGILGARGISVAIAEAEARRQQIDAAKATAEAAAAAAGTTFGDRATVIWDLAWLYKRSHYDP